MPIKSDVLGRAAKRPVYSVLDTSRFTRITGMHPRSWKEALNEFLLEEFRAEDK